MKVVFALVVLLHLCHSNDNKKVYTEIIKGLNELKELGPANISLPRVFVPSMNMKTDQSSCVWRYVEELKGLLGNVTMNKSNKHIIQGLQANLNFLNRTVQHNCTMIPSRNIKRHFNPYISFFRKLNSMKKIQK